MNHEGRKTFLKEQIHELGGICPPNPEEKSNIYKLTQEIRKELANYK